MDMEGKRLLAKYYDSTAAPFATLKSQQAFERTLFARSSTNTNMYAGNEVTMLDGYVAIFRANLDCIVYVVGGAQQNEMMLSCVLDTYFDVLTELLKPQLDKMTLLDHFELVVLALDATIDRGIILETEAKEILAKLAKPPAPTLQSLVEKPLQKQTLSSAFKFAKESVRSFF